MNTYRHRESPGGRRASREKIASNAVDSVDMGAIKNFGAKMRKKTLGHQEFTERSLAKFGYPLDNRPSSG